MLRYLGDSRARRRRLHRAARTTRAEHWTRHRPRRARVGRGVVPRLRLAAVRPDAAARALPAAGTRSRRAGSRRQTRTARRPRRRRAAQHGVDPPDPSCRRHGPGERTAARTSRAAVDRRDARPPAARGGSLGAAGRCALALAASRVLAGAKLACDAARYAARRSAPAAAACRRASRRLPRRPADRRCARAPTLQSSATLLRARLGVDADGVRRGAATAARFGPPPGRETAAHGGAARARASALECAAALGIPRARRAGSSRCARSASPEWTPSSWPRARARACARSRSAGPSRCCRSTAGL